MVGDVPGKPQGAGNRMYPSANNLVFCPTSLKMGDDQLGNRSEGA